MTRLPDWRTRLTAYLAEVARRPFRPGSMDCAMFVAGAVKAMTGEDPAAGFRGRYYSLSGGRRLVTAAGHADMIGVAAAQFPEVAPIFAQAGDIAVVDGDDGAPAFGLVQGALIYVRRPEGLGLVPLTDARRAFRV